MSYISSAFPRFAEHMEPHEIVFQLAKSGKARQLKQYLNRRGKDERKKIVSTKYNGATSLIMACRNGHYDVVEYLVEHCQSNLEQSGLVNFEGENIEGAPPLWCASAAGHLKIVKYLVSKGANVNSTTKSNSTALRAACFDGHVEIVKFLVENNADIEIANRHGHTCLMIACYKGHFAIAKYLISKEADLNRKSVKGNTALHDCAECGSLEIMKLLLSHNAKMAPDAYQMTPLLAAAVTGHSQIVEYLLTRPECTENEKIAALELLGATFVDKKHDMLSAYNYWKSALDRRRLYSLTNDDEITKKSTIKHNPIEAYDYATEFMTEKELDEIISDPDDVRMQALLIRERILGPTHPDTTYYIRYRGAVYADCGNFRKCILLWLYALDTQQKSLDPLHPMIQSSFLSFTELFQYMQKQLSPTLNSSSSFHNSRDDNSLDLSGNGSGGFNMVNMYSATVLKILQQAVEEIKRGLYLLKQYQKNSNSSINNIDDLSTNTTHSNNINQMQRQKIQSSLGYSKLSNVNNSNNNKKGWYLFFF
jgi:ankyrin repeat protein